MGTVYSAIRWGSWSMPGGNPYPNNLAYASEELTKSASPKRVRPTGSDLLFNGTNVSYTRVKSRYGSYTTSYTIGGTTSFTCQLTPPSETGTGFSPVTAAEWGNEIRAKLKDQSVNLAQAFAERKQTAMMFADFGKRILNAYKHLKHANARGVFQALSGGQNLNRGWKGRFSQEAQRFGDHWLAWQYGIRPLISDLQGSIREYYKTRGVSPLIRTVRHTTGRKQDRNRSGGLVTDHIRTGSVICHAEFFSGAAHWDQTANRLGLTDPVMLLWEIIPYSFVIDWFLNVGDFIQASGTVSGLKRVGISVTSDYRAYSTNINTVHGGAPAFRSYRFKLREFTSTLPGATLRISSSPFGSVGSLDRVFSALALARQPLGTASLPTRFGR